MEWLGIVELVLAIILLALLPLLCLAIRRRWLARAGGTFECSMRLRQTTPGTGWVLGVARYSGDELQWFRIFSMSAKPRMTFPRKEIAVLETRAPDPVEALSLYAGQKVVRFEHREDLWDLAMSPDSVTGLLSWLEASPPGAAVSY